MHVRGENQPVAIERLTWWLTNDAVLFGMMHGHPDQRPTRAWTELNPGELIPLSG